MLTLRQIEVIRAIVITGSVGRAARLLNVSSPGISRVMKHAEGLLGLKLFSRKGGRYPPTPEASDIFTQINEVFPQRSVRENLILAAPEHKRPRLRRKFGSSDARKLARCPMASRSCLIARWAFMADRGSCCWTNRLVAMPVDALKPRHRVADVIYTPAETQLIKAAKARGARALTGGSMCVHQAAEAFQLFTGLGADVQRMHRTFVRALAERDQETVQRPDTPERWA